MEVLPEQAGGDPRAEVDAGGGQAARVGRHGGVRVEPDDLASLEQLETRVLQAGGKLADLREQHRPHAGLLEGAHLVWRSRFRASVDAQ